MRKKVILATLLVPSILAGFSARGDFDPSIGGWHPLKDPIPFGKDSPANPANITRQVIPVKGFGGNNGTVAGVTNVSGMIPSLVQKALDALPDPKPEMPTLNNPVPIPKVPTREQVVGQLLRAGNMCGDILSLGAQGAQRKAVEDGYSLQLTKQSDQYQKMSNDEKIQFNRTMAETYGTILSEYEQIIQSNQQSKLDVQGMIGNATFELQSRVKIKDQVVPQIRANSADAELNLNEALNLITQTIAASRREISDDASNNTIRVNTQRTTDLLIKLKQMAYARENDMGNLIGLTIDNLKPDQAEDLIRELTLSLSALSINEFKLKAFQSRYTNMRVSSLNALVNLGVQLSEEDQKFRDQNQ